MEKAVEHARSQFSTVRTGRAVPGARREARSSTYYGSDVPLQQLAGFSVPEARLLVVSPYDKGDSMAAIEKAIRNSDLGLNPSNDGVGDPPRVPPLTEERRKELREGRASTWPRKGKVAVRNLRRDARKHLERARRTASISADELERAEKELDKLTHEHEAEIDKALDAQGARAARGLGPAGLDPRARRRSS